MSSRVVILVALIVAGCGDEVAPGAAPEPPASTATDQAIPTPATDTPRPASSHGGTVVSVGPHLLEIVAQGDGLVVAYVHEGSAALSPGAHVTVRLTGDDGGQHPVLLVWDPAETSYRGRLYRVAAIPGPIRVTVVDGGATHEGEATTVVVTSPPAPAAAARPTGGRPATAEPVPEATPEPEPSAPVAEPEPAPTPADPDPAPTSPIVQPPVVTSGRCSLPRRSVPRSCRGAVPRSSTAARGRPTRRGGVARATASRLRSASESSRACARNLDAGRVSTVAVSKNAGGVSALLALALTCAPAVVAAQESGWELALDGPRQVRLGRTARYRGVAYRVRGLAALAPEAARVRARIEEREGTAGAWAEVRAAADGTFDVEVPVPSGVEGEVFLDVEVGPEDGARRFSMRVQPRPAVTLVLRTDRRLYEPGEPVHVWAWLREGTSERPLVGQAIELALAGPSMPRARRTVETGPSGVAHLELAVADGAPEGSMTITGRLEGQLETATSFHVGTRTWERVFAEVEVEPEPVAPGAAATVAVRVTATSGAPVRDATVALTVEGTRYDGATGADGVARIAVTAPVYLEHDTGSISVRAEIHHPGYGTVNAFGTLRLAVPLSLSIEAVPRHGGLIPELDDVLFVRLHDGVGDPPAQPVEVTVEGPAVRGGRATATTDAHGIAEIPVRLPVGASAGRGSRPQTSVLVTAAGPLERLARVYLPVFDDAEVLPIVDRPVAEPGSRVAIAIARRPTVARRPVTLELLDAQGEIVALTRLAPAARSASVDLPADRLGLFTVRARAVHADETLEGRGAIARLIVRPASPDFPTVTPARTRWTVGETAHVELGTRAGGPRRWAAVLVRDLAAHGGEQPFASYFLARSFREALLTPTDEAGRRLVSATLAADLALDAEPHPAPALTDALGLPAYGALQDPRGGFRDPWPLARELERRGVARPMRALEDRLAQAIDAGGLDSLTRVTGGRRAFREDALADEDWARTLGGEPLTPAMIEASDPSFRYDAAARRVARARLVRLLVALAAYLDPGDQAPPAARMAAREPSSRWLPRLVERGLIRAEELDDPWGGRFALRETRSPALVLSPYATAVELVSPGPDGRLGTTDDVRDPFARAVPAGTPYALASGEDELMRRLAVLSPVERTLAAIAESFRRVSAEMSEDEIGDAVAAEVSEGTIGLGNLGLVGHGAGGGGSGSGYGSGHGGLRGRTARVPSVRSGMASVTGLAAVLRERFPPTLLFRPAVEVDPSGRTDLAIPLADAVTTYLVEVLVWREDGWSWSESTRIEVDRDVVVTAPVPAVAHRGDRIALPVRVSNRGETERRLEVRVAGIEALGIADAPAQALTVGPGDARAVEVELAPSRLGEGQLAIAVVDPSGAALDAIRLPLRVVEVARRVGVEEERIAAGEVAVELAVPAGADPREGAIDLAVGTSLFAPDVGSTIWCTVAGEDADRIELLERAQTAEDLGFAIGVAWTGADVEDDALDEALDRLTASLESARRRPPEEDASLAVRAFALLGLHPLVAASPRDLPRARELVARLRREVGAQAMTATDPATWALAAAALGWTAPDGDLERPRELLRRLARHVVTIGEDRWLVLPSDTPRGSVLMAMTELALGDRAQAFAILATLERWSRQGHAIDAQTRALARLAVRRMTRGSAPEAATVVVDGASRRVELVDGAARVDAPELARPGPHRVSVSAPDGAPVFVSIASRYGVDWGARPERAGPLALALEGEVGALDEESELELVVRNRAPRTLRRPIVEIQLPTGAELTHGNQLAMGVRVERLEDTLVLTLPPLLPGQTRRLPVPIRWSVAGELRGLGVAGRADDRPEAVSVLPPRTVTIREVAR